MGKTSSNEVKGSTINTTTSLGIKLSAEFINNGFDRIRIYRIHYETVGQFPTIYIADEVKID